MADTYRISLDEFISALETGKGPSARALDTLCTAPYDMDSDFVKMTLATTSGFTPLPDWVTGALLEAGAAQAEIDHLDEFPEEQKILVRNAIADAIDANPQRNVRFFWELTAAAAPEVEVEPGAGANETVVHVRTPRSALQSTDVRLGLVGDVSD